MNKLLSCKFLYPLSRISYCAYLVHPIVMISVIMHMDSPVHLGRATMVCNGGSDTTSSDNLNCKLQGIHKVCPYFINLLHLNHIRQKCPDLYRLFTKPNSLCMLLLKYITCRHLFMKDDRTGGLVVVDLS